MIVTSIVIKGVEGKVTITRKLGGVAMITVDGDHLTMTRPGESPENRAAKAKQVAGAVYGTREDGEPDCTDSMITDVLYEMDRVTDDPIKTG